MNNTFAFYMDRIASCPFYGFVSGHQLLQLIIDCALFDDQLTEEQVSSIINSAERCHIKMMEENYNAGWKTE